MSEAGRPKRLSPLHERLGRARRGFRHEERLGARRLLPPGRAVAARRRGPARVRLGEAAVARPRRGRARGDARAARDHRHDVVRQARDRAERSTCSSVCAAPDRQARRLGRLHAAARRARADRRRRDGDAARGGSLPRSSPAPARSTATAGSSSCTARAVDDVTDELAVIGIWGPRHARRCSARRRDSVSHGAVRVTIGGVPVLAQRITYVGEFGYELYVDARPARSRSGMRSSPPARRSPSATRRSTRSASRRATATSAPT